MPSRTIIRTQGGVQKNLTVNRDRKAAVTAMTRTGQFSDLDQDTTSMQVTVEGHANISGIYTGTTVAGATWTQQGGTGTIRANNFSPTDGYSYLLEDDDSDPQTLLNTGAGFTSRPWEAVLPNGVTLTGVPQTLSVNRTAPVITSDRKGESRPLLSKLVGGVTMAYSLRDLNDKQGNNKVVRVRRASDNAERDFLAKEVSNGTLKNWVNTQTVLPLDLQELTADGRTGSVIPASAAYSLRNLSSSYTGNVIEVRRSSDNTTQNFTADEVTDGTLVAFTNADYVKYTSDFSSGLDGWLIRDDLTGASNVDGIGGLDDNLRLTIGSATSVHRTFRTGILPVNQKINFSIKVYIPSSNSGVDSLRIADASGTEIIPSTTPARDQWVTLTASNITPTNSSGQLRLFLQDGGVSSFTGNGSDVIYIREVVVTQVSSDGSVKTWYDQSGNTNHATQPTFTNQPKIVSAGSLVVDSLGVPELEFDGSNDVLNVGAGFASSSKTIFSVNNPDSLSSNGLFAFGSSQTDRFFAQYTSNLIRTEINGAQAGVSASTQKNLTTNLHTTDISVGLNGGSFTTTSASFSGVSASAELKIGQRFGTAFTDNFDGTIQEFIVYNSDQTDNRTAIEANIGEHYSISGIPAYDNTVDGFVETWYDQSGNGTNAVQATASKQPKIVNAGTLLNELDFDGSDDQLDFTALNESDFSIFSVANFDDAAGQDRILSTAAGADSSGFGKGSATAGFFRASSGSANQPALNTTISADQDTLLSFIRASDTGAFFINGTASSTFSNSTAFKASAIGGHGSKIDGSLKEIIIYDSNQTANRPAIEANINNQYDIY